MQYIKLKLGQPGYPRQLIHLADPPQQLYVCGNGLEHILSKPMIAIVGTRKPSHYGQAVTDKITRELVKCGVVTVSGLALGIDSLAHKATLAVGGKTIAVLPSGLDHIYPSIHTNLAKQLVDSGGALVSEYDFGHRPMKYDFIARNRIIAALADAIIVPEAALKSGSIHTANFGLELGKPIFAVPGNITSYLSEGTNNLIKLGATPLTKAEDILIELGIQPSEGKHLIGSNPAESKVIELISMGTTDASEIMAKSGLDQVSLQRTLSMLEINGALKCIGNNRWMIA